jgi:hypothetical protein
MNNSPNTSTVGSVSVNLSSMSEYVKRDLLLTLLKESVYKCYEKDYSLIRRGGMEQASMARVYYYMQKALEQDPRFESFSAYKLDCEYNKNGEDPKWVEGVGDTRPDIILHNREDKPCKDNVLILEFKTHNNNDHGQDIRKLESFTNPQYDYRYFLGVFVKLKKDGPPEYRYFQNGRECE